MTYQTINTTEYVVEDPDARIVFTQKENGSLWFSVTSKTVTDEHVVRMSRFELSEYAAVDLMLALKAILRISTSQ